jgi:hypothetical protein
LALFGDQRQAGRSVFSGSVRLEWPVLAFFLFDAIFLNRKTMEKRKLPTEAEVAGWLRKDQLRLPPLRFKLKPADSLPHNGKRRWNYAVEASWKDQTAKFVVESKTLSTPKAFDEALQQCKSRPLPRGYYPLVLTPYLRQSQLEELESNDISGVDWCGNGVVIVPGKFRVFRTGNPNQFATYAPIKNIYRKNTSMVARVLLTARQFPDVQRILAEVNSRNILASATNETPMTMGTVSKALKQLEDDLIIDRDKGVRVIQPDTLLENLQSNYEPPKSSNRVRLKVDCKFERLPRFLVEKRGGKNAPLVATGLASVSKYAAMQREEVLSVYVPDIRPLRSVLGTKESDRFPNLELIENNDQPYYFDARLEMGFQWASPVQTYLELMSGDKRDQETAEQVKAYILNQLEKSIE